MMGVLVLCFTPLTSIIGHAFVSEDGAQVVKYFNFFHVFNFLLGLIFFLGFYAVVDNLVSALFGDGLELSKSISFVITINFFIQFLRQTVMLFRDATGTFYNDRWKPLVEGLLNIALSILFVKVFPEEYSVVGVIVATIITNLFICHIVEPHVLFKYAFKSSAKRYYIRNYAYIAVFAVALVAVHFCSVDLSSVWAEFFANGFIAIGLALPICVGAVLLNKDFRHYLGVIINKFKLRRGKKPEVATVLNETDDTKSDSEVDEISVDSQK